MKYIVACSIFITDEGGCAPIYIDLAIYILGTVGLILLYALMRKLITYLIHLKG